ncbi:MAG: zinc ribbon domain-containing protein [Anaerolineales bacterium]|nr:zinc ribbon domain-containing protein [Anaerolineales bacterium]MCW5855988.1 zinc ribbon domain-containing protein [Anaerolineales bacterium]
MRRKVIGYVELYWQCPACSSENLGSHAYCTSCGTPQPQDVEFHAAVKQQLLTDAEQIKRAKAGADIHCGFCGTRNAADAAKCSQCGADLTAGAKRKVGQVVGAFAQGALQPIACPNCSTMNAGNRRKCGSCGTALSQRQQPKAPAAPQAGQPKIGKGWLLGCSVALLLICSLVYFLFLHTESIEGQVVSAGWNRSIVVEAFTQVRLEDWYDDVPFDADNVSCREAVRGQQSSPPLRGSYREVCGTEYIVDTGTGAGEVVQDCYYEVYDDYCSYTGYAWAPYTTVVSEGSGLSARWPDPQISSEMRLGEQREQYVCTFQAGGQTYTYDTSSYSEFQRCQIGSRWLLEVNSLGAVTSISPAE